MKRLIAAVCFMLAAAPMALAQDKAKDTEKKAPMAAEKSAKSDAAKGKVDEKKSDMGTEKSAKGDKKEPSAKQKAQQDRMKDCSGKAGERKGDERKTFMSSCLKGGETDAKADKSDKRTAQQDKMKSCNKEAGDKKMKGDDRKSFMKDCLSK
jgi:hypothetical protein